MIKGSWPPKDSHRWEDLGPVERMAVPGGWLYLHGEVAVFVPAPPGHQDSLSWWDHCATVEDRLARLQGAGRE